jgi:hypothetical protein
MRRTALAIVLALLAPLAASAAPATYTTIANRTVQGACASGTCDAPVEAAGATDGADLVRFARGLVVTVCAASGQTLSGAGTLTAYLREPGIALWAAAPELNLTVTSSARRCQTFSGFMVTVPRGRATWVPTGVTVSGGGVTVYISGY